MAENASGERMPGWVALGVILMGVVGAFKLVSGIIGLVQDEYLINGFTGYRLVDVTGLAIWWLLVGALLILASFAVLRGKTWGYIVGLTAAALATLSEFFSIPYTPIWSIVMIIVYVVIMAAFVKAAPGSEEELEMEQAAVVAPPPVVEEAPTVAAAPAVAAASVAASAVTTEPPFVAVPMMETVSEEPAARGTYDLMDIEGIGPAYAEKLAALGLKTTDDLLQAGATPKGREDLAASTGISAKLILRWVNMADLFRIKGVGEEYSDLLEAAGVDTVPELAQRRADNLWAKMAEVNEQKQLVRRLPTQDQVAGWIDAAKSLPRVVTY